MIHRGFIRPIPFVKQHDVLSRARINAGLHAHRSRAGEYARAPERRRCVCERGVIRGSSSRARWIGLCRALSRLVLPRPSRLCCREAIRRVFRLASTSSPWLCQGLALSVVCWLLSQRSTPPPHRSLGHLLPASTPTASNSTHDFPFVVAPTAAPVTSDSSGSATICKTSRSVEAKAIGTPSARLQLRRRPVVEEARTGVVERVPRHHDEIAQIDAAQPPLDIARGQQPRHVHPRPEERVLHRVYRDRYTRHRLELSAQRRERRRDQRSAHKRHPREARLRVWRSCPRL